MYWSRLRGYVVGDDLEDLGQQGELDDLDAFLHHVVAVYVLDQVETVGLDGRHHLSLLLLPVFNELYCLLDHPAPVAVLSKIEEVGLDDREETLLVVLLSPLKNLLEDVVAELVLGKLHALLEQGFEDSLLGVGLAVLNDVLHRSGAVLVTSPSASLLQVVQNFLFGSWGGVVLRHGNVD